MGILRSTRARFSNRVGGWLTAVLLLTLGCRKTFDSLGSNDTIDAAKRELQDLSGPTDYPNAFHDALGKTSDEINAKITNAFNTLFHGNPLDQAIFFLVGDDRACIKDIYHDGEVRTEGMGLGMIIAVELNKQLEFDQLWRYAKENLMIQSGSARGYFNSHCDVKDDESANSRVCLDPYGLQQFTMALVLANARWGSGSVNVDAGAMDYNSDAWMLLDVMRYKEQENGGVVDGITNTFDAHTLLVFDEPTVFAYNYTSPSAQLPAYYDVWAQATGDSFWSAVAINARGFWPSVANADTGLLPDKAYFTGTSYQDWDMFGPEGYRAQLNMTLDRIWTGPNTWEDTEANRIIDFFGGILDSGATTYSMSYQLDGTVIDATAADASLVAVNGGSALIASSSHRKEFIQAVWDLDIPTGNTRYYRGILYLLSLLTLSGEYRVSW